MEEEIQKLETRILELAQQYSETTNVVTKVEIENKIKSCYLEMQRKINDLLKITNYARCN